LTERHILLGAITTGGGFTAADGIIGPNPDVPEAGSCGITIPGGGTCGNVPASAWCFGVVGAEPGCRRQNVETIQLITGIWSNFYNFLASSCTQVWVRNAIMQ